MTSDTNETTTSIPIISIPPSSSNSLQLMVDLPPISTLNPGMVFDSVLDESISQPPQMPISNLPDAHNMTTRSKARVVKPKLYTLHFMLCLNLKRIKKLSRFMDGTKPCKLNFRPY